MAAGLFITVTVIPSNFTIDDYNYLVNVIAARQGHVTLQNTAGLTPSQELLAFDPVASSRAVTRTPIASAAPPLYGLIAVPFSVFGWRGLVALNTLGFLGTVVLVFTYTRRFSGSTATSWLAAAAFGLGGWALEYALGLWPHMLSVVLCTGAIVTAGRAIANGPVAYGAVAGLLVGLATGIRYQNAILIAALGAGLFFWSTRRVRMVAAFLLAVALPLATSATINKVRLDSWNPISKGPGYLAPDIGGNRRSPIGDPARMLWGRVVDYTVRPPMQGADFDGWLSYDAATGAHLMDGETIKKAVLQSAPWAVLAIWMLVAAWAPGANDPRRRQLRFLSLIVAFVLATFSIAGPSRDDSLAYNQRYLLELLPILAIAFAWRLDGGFLSRRAIVIGFASAVAIAGAGLVATAVPTLGGGSNVAYTRVLWVMKAPLVLTTLLLATTWLGRRRLRAAPIASALVGASLGWGLAIHVGQDVIASQMRRLSSLERSKELGRVLPARSAVVAYWGMGTAAAPLLFDRDIVVADPRPDHGRTSTAIVRELLARRRVFVIGAGLPPEMLRVITDAFIVTEPTTALQIVEIVAAR